MISIEELSPSIVFKHFSNLCAIPRPSKHEEKAVEYIVQFAIDHKLRYQKDTVGNVIIWKGASAEYESVTPVILQGHLDMVVQARAGKVHDPINDPIEPYIDGDLIKARDTTLGADNGVGVSIALAILESKDLPHGPIEALFTIDEETGMTGAFHVKSGLLKGKILINLDTEQEDELCIGCAGGQDASIKLPLVNEALSTGYKAAQITVGGLKGGHSGIDINLGRGNAIKILTRFLFSTADSLDLRLVSMSAGSARNAIPRDSKAVVAFPEKEYALLEELTKKFSSVIQDELSVADPGVVVTINEVNKVEKILSKQSQNSLLKSLYACPNGVLRMSDRAPGVVETSNNLAIVNTNNSAAEIHCLLRSSSDTAKADCANMVSAVFSLAGADVALSGGYPGWQPDPNSSIVKLMEKTYRDIYNKDIEILVVHAGLECGIIGSNYPGLEMVSCGPTIRFPHSPDEQLEIKSVGRFWTYICEVLKRIPKLS